MSAEDEFFSKASALQVDLMEINRLRDLISGYRKSSEDFASLATAEEGKLAEYVAEVRPKVVSLMQEFLTVTNPPSA